jgi:predicted DNA-binding transcriptional regulator AlpA
MNVPFDRVIWGAQECADYIGLSRQEFLRTIRHKPDFPRELRMPRRWRAADVVAWKETPAPPRKPPTCLYRHFDSSGALLYVGISLNALVRMSRHSRDSRWFDRVATITVERFPTRQEALLAERKAVATEKPPFNVKLKHGTLGR